VLPVIPPETLDGWRGASYATVAASVLSLLLEGEVPEDVVRALCDDAYTYPVPLHELGAGSRQYLLHLDRGPTASFKDFAARMMARLMQYFLAQSGANLLILTATSGDTGGAVCDAFYGMDNINVCVLFPVTEVSERQRRQMTTLGKNIQAIGVEGKFDDCQAFVKEAFADPDLAGFHLSSANSINIGRLLPQSVYYFWSYLQVCAPGEEFVVSVPSGNFGDLMGGLIAKRLGLPAARFIAATNENNEFPLFLETGTYSKIVPSLACISNAMNVGHPSNLARLIHMYGGIMDHEGTIHRMPDMDAIRRDIASWSITDEETRGTIDAVWCQHQYLVDPHGAVGWAALARYSQANPSNLPAVSFETADPAKFPEEIIAITGQDPPMPESMVRQQTLPEHYAVIQKEYNEFKRILVDRYRT
jgi:threonine synthase